MNQLVISNRIKKLFLKYHNALHFSSASRALAGFDFLLLGFASVAMALSVMGDEAEASKLKEMN
jgi:hypothetical protein